MLHLGFERSILLKIEWAGQDETSFSALQCRVENWRHTLRFSLSVSPRFLWECLTNQAISWFPVPATSNRTGAVSASGFPIDFTVGLSGIPFAHE
jgi:hypothetical protein